MKLAVAALGLGIGSTIGAGAARPAQAQITTGKALVYIGTFVVGLIVGAEEVEGTEKQRKAAQDADQLQRLIDSAVSRAVAQQRPSPVPSLPVLRSPVPPFHVANGSGTDWYLTFLRQHATQPVPHIGTGLSTLPPNRATSSQPSSTASAPTPQPPPAAASGANHATDTFIALLHPPLGQPSAQGYLKYFALTPNPPAAPTSHPSSAQGVKKANPVADAQLAFAYEYLGLSAPQNTVKPRTSALDLLARDKPPSAAAASTSRPPTATVTNQTHLAASPHSDAGKNYFELYFPQTGTKLSVPHTERPATERPPATGTASSAQSILDLWKSSKLVAGSPGLHAPQPQERASLGSPPNVRPAEHAPPSVAPTTLVVAFKLYRLGPEYRRTTTAQYCVSYFDGVCQPCDWNGVACKSRPEKLIFLQGNK